MKKLLFLFFSVLILVSCGSKQPVEKSISKADVDLTGNAFNSFRLGGETKLLMVPSTDDKSKWMIRATTPLQKTDDITIGEMTAEINLLDGNGTKVREGFFLTANDLASIIPVFNTNNEAERNIVFSASENIKKDFTYSEAVDLISRVEKIGLTINTSKPYEHYGAVQREVTATPQNNNIASLKGEKTSSTESTVKQPSTNVEDEPLTLNSLLKKHGIYGMLAQYEKMIKKGDRIKAKQIEDRMYEIEKRVQRDQSIPSDLRTRFVRYIEDKEDEIEDKY